MTVGGVQNFIGAISRLRRTVISPHWLAGAVGRRSRHAPRDSDYPQRSARLSLEQCADQDSGECRGQRSLQNCFHGVQHALLARRNCPIKPRSRVSALLCGVRPTTVSAARPSMDRRFSSRKTCARSWRRGWDCSQRRSAARPSPTRDHSRFAPVSDFACAKSSNPLVYRTVCFSSREFAHVVGGGGGIRSARSTGALLVPRRLGDHSRFAPVSDFAAQSRRTRLSLDRGFSSREICARSWRRGWDSNPRSS